MSLKDVMMAVHAEKHLASKKGKGQPQASKRARGKTPPAFLKGKKGSA